VRNNDGTTSRQRYMPFGAPRGTPGQITQTDRGFLGKTEDDTTNLAQLDARYYDPTTARFISVDPLLSPGDPQTLNGYAYAGNSPVSRADPSGLSMEYVSSLSWANLADYFPDETGGRWVMTGHGGGASVVPFQTDVYVARSGVITQARTIEGGETYDTTEQIWSDLGGDFDVLSEYAHDCAYATAACDAAITYVMTGSLGAARVAYSATCGPTASAGCDIGAVIEDDFTQFVVETVVISGLSLGASTLTRVLVRAATRSAAAKAIATGQEHHVISRRIAAALEDHPTLAGQYAPRDPRFVTRAADAAAHRGYQTWHRQLDAEVADWLARNPNATTTQFERFLQGRYTQPDLLERFPNGF
jgi:RHS repeat-associated protein